MVINTIGAAEIQKFFLAGANAIDAKKETINDLNVFPVPDGDTGTNMTMTIMAAAREVASLTDPDMKQICKAISSGSLRGARGNSGVILSQLLRGFTKVVGKAEQADVRVLADAFERAVDSAYKAVMKPKEGTILTVARCGAQKAAEMAERTDNIIEMINAVILHMRDVLDQTPDMLPVLKEAGVVDSGGEGLLVILEGAYDALLGKEVSCEIEQEKAPGPAPAATGVKAVEDADIRYGYCTEYIIMLEKSFGAEEEKEFKAYLESIGDSIVCVADEDVVKVHVHTNDPGLAIQKGLSYGALTSMKIDNMREEHNERVIFQSGKNAEQNKNAEKNAGQNKKTEENAEPNINAEKSAEKEKWAKNGFICVSVGDGLDEIFRGLGADKIIAGGQTMNPSTEDILEAISQVNADTVFVLPNNSNIVLAAEQARDLTKDKQVVVVPSKNIPQGISALIQFSEGLSLEENLASMEEGMKAVKSGQITYAVRDTSLDGKTIKAGDIMGLTDKTIETVGTDVVDTTAELVRKMIDEDSEVVTLYYGEEASEEEANQIADRIKSMGQDLQIDVEYGGQPIYYFFVSVE